MIVYLTDAYCTDVARLEGAWRCYLCVTTASGSRPGECDSPVNIPPVATRGPNASGRPLLGRLQFFRSPSCRCICPVIFWRFLRRSSPLRLLSRDWPIFRPPLNLLAGIPGVHVRRPPRVPAGWCFQLLVRKGICLVVVTLWALRVASGWRRFRRSAPSPCRFRPLRMPGVAWLRSIFRDPRRAVGPPRCSARPSSA